MSHDMTATVRAGSLRGFAALVAGLGHDPSALVGRFGLDSSILTDEDARVPMRHVIAMLESTAAALNCPDLGLKLAQLQDASTLGPIAIALEASATVGASLDIAARYLFTHSPANIFTVADDGDHLDSQLVELRYEIILARLPPVRQAWDLGIGLAHRMLRTSAGAGYQPTEVLLPHAPLAKPSTYTRYFGAPVRFEQRSAGIIIPRSLLALPNVGSDALVRHVAARYLDMQFPAPGNSASAQVRHCIQRAFGSSDVSLAYIAAVIGSHPRTLQRRLRKEGASFEVIRDQARRDAAAHYITLTHMKLADISLHLGFAEQSVLTNACIAWFGATPSAIRRKAW